MASKFNFGSLSKQFQAKVERPFLDGGMKLAKDEFAGNFSTESNAETKNPWNDVVRTTSDPILDVSGRLKTAATKDGGIVYGNKKATFNINPIDNRGREYAQYHQDGINQYRTKDEFEREFVTQSDDLNNKQENLLLNLINKLF